LSTMELKNMQRYLLEGEVEEGGMEQWAEDRVEEGMDLEETK
jgi:hypothetical protein